VVLNLVVPKMCACVYAYLVMFAKEKALKDADSKTV